MTPPDGSRSDRSAERRAQYRDVWRGLDESSIMVVELLAGLLTWGTIGWLLDRWLGTWPWLFAIGALVGFGGGLYLVWLRSNRLDERDREAREQGRQGEPRP